MCDYGSDSTTDLMGSEDVLATGKEMGLLDCVTLQIDRSDNPLTLHSPIRGNHGFHKQFGTICEWREFIRSHNLHAAIPQTIAEKFQRAQKLYFLAWIDFDVIKAGELMALVALELALKSRYGDKTLGMLLEHIVEQDGLTNEKIPMFKKNGFVIVENLYETKQAREARKRRPGVHHQRLSRKFAILSPMAIRSTSAVGRSVGISARSYRICLPGLDAEGAP